MGPGKIHINEENFPLTPPHCVSLGFSPRYHTSLPHYPCKRMRLELQLIFHQVCFNSERCVDVCLRVCIKLARPSNNMRYSKIMQEVQRSY